MRMLYTTWQTLTMLGWSREAQNTLALATQLIQTYLNNCPDPALQKSFLSRPYHHKLWQAQQNK